MLKHIFGGAEKVNVVKNLSKPPPPNDEYYHKEESSTFNDQTGVSNQTPKSQIMRIGAKVMETKFITMVIITARVIMFGMGITTAKRTSTEVTKVPKVLGVGLCSTSK